MRHSFLFSACAAVFVIAALVAVPASAQVVFDSASNATPATASNTNPIAVSWFHTVGLAKKTYLVVSVSIDKNGGAQTVTSVFYGTEPGGPAAGAGGNTPASQYQMTLLGAATNGTSERAELWGLANPTPGNHQITVTVANAGGQNTAVVAGAKSFSNVFETAAPGTAIAATGTSLTPAVPALANSAFDYVVDAVAYNNNVALTAGANQTNAFNVVNGAPVFSGGGSTKTGFANTTMSWTATGTAQAWAHVAVPIQSATPAILFDSAASTRFTSATSPVSGSWTHTTTTAANRYLVVGLSIDLTGRNRTASTVTYGTEGGGPNQAMTLIGSISNGTNVRTELFGLVNPASGTHTITASITLSANANFSVVAGSQSFSGVDQSAPIGTAVNATNNSATPNVAVTNLASDYVVDVVGFNGNTTQVEGAQQDLRYSSASATLTNFAGAGSGLRGYTNATMSYSNATATAQQWAMSAVPLKRVSVQINKSVSADVIKLGDSVTYTLTVTNYGSAAVNAVTVTDAVPAGTNFVSQTGCGGTGPVTCNIGTLNPGQSSAPITMTVLATSAGSFSNSASVTWTGATASNNSETIRTLAEAKICASPGKDGAGGTLAGIKNDYWPGGATVAAGSTSITLGARVAGAGGNTIAIGDLLIVMQMQDAAFDTTNDETYGEGTGSTKAFGTGSGAASALNNAGRWEYVVAANAVGTGGGTLNLNGGGAGGGLLYTYTSQTFATTTTQGQRTFQIIRVPQYTTATLGSTLTAFPWNGAVGGVLAIDVSGTLTLGGATVSVNGLGFRGGGGRFLQGDGAANGFLYTDFRTSASNAVNGSKGEGIAGTPRFVYQSGANIGTPGTNAPLDTTVEGYVGGSYGRGGAANAGGGSTDGDPATLNPNGNDMNSGGGGGGNGGNGGSGGNGWSCNCPGGGQGGASINPSLTRITLGGGGGAGTTNNGSAADATGTVLSDNGGPNAAGANGYYSSGGNGGGTVIIRALQATGTATITANGFNGPNSGRDGPGGGGAGGSVLFTTQSGTLGGLTIQAKGGNGGSAWKLQAPGGNPGERHGPGGGGGGGYILLSSAAASTDVSGGTNGTTTTSNDPYGAQPGSAGIVQFISGNNVLPGGDGASCVIVDLAVTNSDSPDPVKAFANVTYTQTLTNNGPNAADGVVYMMPIPASTNFQSIGVPPPGWTCITPAVGGTGSVICTTPSIASGATVNFSLVVQVNVGTPPGYVLTETNSVSSNTPDSNPANNQATTTTLVEAPTGYGQSYADMAITISESTSLPTAGSTISYPQTISNLGTFTANNPTYTVTTPPNTTFQGITPPAGWTCITPAIGGTGPITCSAASLAAGASVTFPGPLTLKVNAGTAAGTAITVTPSVGTSSLDAYAPNNTASVTATVVATGSGDVAITLSTAPDPLYPTENYKLTAVATNNGPNAAANITVTIPIPAGANFQSLTPPAGWSCSTPAVGSAGSITCTIASLAAGASATFTPVAQVNVGTASGTTLSTTATISTTTTDSIASNNSATDTNLVTASTNADMAITKADSPDPVGVGQLVTYHLTVTNNGPAIATNVVVSDTLPASMTFVSATPSIGSCAGTTTISCSLGTLNVGNSQFVDIVVNATATGAISNTATVSATQTDPVASNNSSTATTTVLAVTDVHLRDFAATQDKDRVTLVWRTDYEFDNLGFNVYREVGGQRVKINKNLIAGSALTTKKVAAAGYVYRFHDRLDSASALVQYYLEDVDLRGTRTMHGPYMTTFGKHTDGGDSAPLQGLGTDGYIIESPAGFGVLHDLSLPTASDKQLKQQFELAGDSGLKIFVSTEGWYRITRAAMASAGFDPGSSSKALSLFVAGIEQPLIVDDGGDGKFDADDAIEFYGLNLDTVSTGARTYWLRAKNGGNGDRINLQKDKGAPLGATSVPFTYERKERAFFFGGALTNGDAQNYFGPIITSWPITQDLPASNVDLSSTANASVELTIQGGPDGTHVVAVSINGHDIGTATFTNQNQIVKTLTFPNSWLVNGTNALGLVSLSGDYDATALALTRLTYQHLLRADSNALEVALPGGQSASVGGFGSGSVRALDVTDPQHPIELQVTTTADPAGGFIASFTPATGVSRSVLVAERGRINTTPEMTFNRPSSYNVTSGKSGASLLIISHNAFLSAAAALQPVREKEGTSTMLIDVDDLYDEFNFGIRDPQAIKTFLQYAAQYKSAPKYVLLVGDASLDPRNYMQMGLADFVPTKLVVTAMTKTASDDWFTDNDGDGAADLPIGRLPADSADEAALMINKLTTRGTPSGAWSKDALFIADRPTDFDFGAAARSMATIVPPSLNTRVLDLTMSASPSSDVNSAMNQGALLVDFIGHGSQELWSTTWAFTASDAAAMTNGNRLPVVLAMTCLNGYFFDTFMGSMAESLMKAPNGGAVAVWASSALTQPDAQSTMNAEMLRQIFNNGATLGEAAVRAKRVITDQDVKKSWILFGDPSMRLK